MHTTKNSRACIFLRVPFDHKETRQDILCAPESTTWSQGVQHCFSACQILVKLSHCNRYILLAKYCISTQNCLLRDYKRAHLGSDNAFETFWFDRMICTELANHTTARTNHGTGGQSGKVNDSVWACADTVNILSGTPGWATTFVLVSTRMIQWKTSSGTCITVFSCKSWLDKGNMESIPFTLLLQLFLSPESVPKCRAIRSKVALEPTTT